MWRNLRKRRLRPALGTALAPLFLVAAGPVAAGDFAVLQPDDYRHYTERFAASDDESVVNLVPNATAWEWMEAGAPLFACPSARFEETYYFRWWSYRKHLKQTPQGVLLTEFLTPVSHGGPYNTISCAAGHHVAEGRWLREQGFLDDYARYWYRGGPSGGPAPHFRNFSSWLTAALWERRLAVGDDLLVRDLLDDMVDDYRAWESERQVRGGLFWQFDVRDGMEESISGGRRERNLRPTINSYMAANASAIADIADAAGRSDLAEEFAAKANRLRELLNARLWDVQAQFYKVRRPDGAFSDAREAIGFLPWRFGLAPAEYAPAWKQLTDSDGFRAPRGLTTAERRHPQFRTHGTGTCEWDGAVWPFASSQTLDALQNFLRSDDVPKASRPVSKRDFFEQLLVYAEAHQRDGVAYLGEYYDETTGKWLITGPKERRSRYYNHSTFADLVIRGLTGIVPRADDVLVVDPLLPEDGWDWFCLDGVPYHGRLVTIVWDRDGRRFDRGAGLSVLVDGREAARAPRLSRLEIDLTRIR